MKSAVDVMDVLGLHFVITYILTGKGEIKLLTAGLGWAGAHSLLSYFVVLFVGARTTGFSWHYIQTAFESNNDLVGFLHNSLNFNFVDFLPIIGCPCLDLQSPGPTSDAPNAHFNFAALLYCPFLHFPVWFI
jgi:hypothetical protein